MSLLLLLRGEGGEAEPAPSRISVRERAPLWHAVRVVPPGSARSYRWAGDEPDPANRVSGLGFSSSVPGGFEQAGCTLPRLTGIEYGDLAPLSDVWIYGPGGEVRWEGRLTGAPSVSGDQMAVTPDAVGHKAHLEDDRTVSCIVIDGDLSRWTGPSAQRRIDLLASGSPPSDPQPTWSETAPALRFEVGGAWASPQLPRAEGWYDAGPGNRIARVLASVASNSSDRSFQLLPLVSDDDVQTTTEALADVFAGSATSFDFQPTARYRFARIAWLYASTPAGADGAVYAADLTGLKVIGDHGLTLRTGSDGTIGYFASDILAWAVGRWAPRLRVTAESIQQTSYVIQQLAIYEAGNLQALFDEVTKYGLEDYAVWDDRTVWLYQPGTVGKTWITRSGPAKLRQTGRADARLWNGVMVRFPATDGTTRTVGPPGSGADVEDAVLRDDDPENEANQLGILRMPDPLDMGSVSVAGEAIEVGRRFLLEARQLDRSGSAELVGYVTDDRGIEHPVSAVRGGDRLIVADARDPSPRRIVRASYSADTFTTAVDLDAPPESMNALLARLGLAVQGVS